MEKLRFEDLPEAVSMLNEKIDLIISLLRLQTEQLAFLINGNEFLTVPEAAKLTRYSEQTIRLKVMQGNIPSIKLGGKRLFNKEELLKWIEEKG